MLLGAHPNLVSDEAPASGATRMRRSSLAGSTLH